MQELNLNEETLNPEDEPLTYGEFLEICRTYSLNDILEVLNESGFDVNSLDDNGRNALMSASMGNSVDVIKELIQMTENINAQDKQGNTALMFACASNDAEAADALLDSGVDITLVNENGDTALNFAMKNLGLKGSNAIMILLKRFFLKLCKSGSEEEIQYAVNAGIDVNSKNKSQATGLMFAAQHNTAGSVEILLDAGAEIDAQDINGNTALIHAASYNTDDVVDVLINRGADVNIMNHSGHKALNFAKMNYRLFDTVALNVLEKQTRD